MRYKLVANENSRRSSVPVRPGTHAILHDEKKVGYVCRFDYVYVAFRNNGTRLVTGDFQSVKELARALNNV